MILCNKIIWLEGQEGHANTYCMKEAGHKGKCLIEAEECKNAMCWFAANNIEHKHSNPQDLTKARVEIDAERWHGVWGTSG